MREVLVITEPLPGYCETSRQVRIMRDANGVLWSACDRHNMNDEVKDGGAVHRYLVSKGYDPKTLGLEQDRPLAFVFDCNTKTLRYRP